MTSTVRSANGPAIPWGSWMKAGEVAMTAPMVIGMRLTQMLIAGPKPTRRDQREVRRMSQEKVAAFGDQLWGSAAVIGRVNVEIAGLVMRSAMAGAAWPLMAMSQSFGGVPVRMMAAAVDPVHSRVRANHRRLATTRRRP